MSQPGHMDVAGEDIPAESSCVLSMADGKVYRAGEHSGVFIGNSVEQIREGFRVAVWNGEVREDDA